MIYSCGKGEPIYLNPLFSFFFKREAYNKKCLKRAKQGRGQGVGAQQAEGSLFVGNAVNGGEGVGWQVSHKGFPDAS
jgi:hypothetical protein